MRARRIVALVLGLWGASWLFYAGIIAPPLLEVPVPIVNGVFGALGIVAAVGIFAREWWARWLGIAFTTLVLLAGLWYLARYVSHSSDPLISAAMSAIEPIIAAVILFLLLRRWPSTADPGSPRRADAGPMEGPTAGLTMAWIRIFLVSSLLIGGVLGCNALIEADLQLIPGGGEEAAAPTIEPLGRVVEGGRVEMPGSGFAITLPHDWTVEVVDPDPDVFTASPGDAWEALRAYDPEHREACSVFVAVPAGGQRSLEESGVGTDGGAVEPYWSSEDRQSILLVRPPRIETESGGGMGIIAPHERPHSSDARLQHDVLYAVVCETDHDRDLDAITQSVEFLPSDG